MKIVVTGFEAFLTHDENPTQKIISLLPNEIDGHQVIPCLLSVSFEQSSLQLLKFVQETQPDVVIMLGLAGGRTAISLERVAINIDHTTSPDNLGVTKHHEPIDASGATAYFTTLPLDTIIQRLKSKEIPCEISNSAGTYVCNNIFYQMMNYIQQTKEEIVAGFIHVPYMSSQVTSNKYFSLSLSTLVVAVQEAIYACIK